MYIKTFWEQHCSICEMTLRPAPWKNYPVTNGLKSGERCGPLASNNTWLEEKTFQYQHFGKVIIARSKIIISIPDLECILFNFTQSQYDRNMVIHSMSSSQRQLRLCDYGTPLCVKFRIKSQSLDVVKMIPYLLNQSVNPIPFRIR